ncbi:MAG TPA: outer membrane beta-barrel protein [Kofleriaceae bacterium]|jgi:hypothetical protein|nr:outer membrane beta-barrel protein [Kofleriaceae bacterium]
MKLPKTLLVLAIMLVPGIAAAQGYYGRGGGYSQSPASELPGGFHNRMGRLAFGFSLGLGGMHDNGSAVTSCNNCNYNPIAFEVDGHVGGFLTPRFALMGELQTNGQTVHSDVYNGDTVLLSNTLMIAGQYWLSPQLWVKGGVGFATLQAQDDYFEQDLGNGSALMGGVGFEVFSARDLAVDLQGRIIRANYHGIDDGVTSATVGVGINWY